MTTTLHTPFIALASNVVEVVDDIPSIVELNLT